jgi:hypothetical protein
MPAAIAIPAIIGAASAGTSLASAKMQSNAANRASKAQSASQDTSQAFNQQAFDYQKQLMNPYAQAGQTSLANLMAQHWGGSPADYSQQQGPPQGQQAMPGQRPQGMAPTMGQAMPRSQGGQPLGGFAGPQGGMPQQGQAAPGMGQPAQQPGGGGQMVRMRAPTGEVTTIPAAMAAQFEQRGAVRVG